MLPPPPHPDMLPLDVVLTTSSSANTATNLLSPMTSVLVGIGAGIVLLKGHGRLVQSARSAIAYWRNPLRHQTVYICTTFEECETAVRQLKTFCAEYRVLGFDCEWVTVNASKRPVALLQLAAHNGYCALIRLHRLRGAPLPASLCDLLANGDIVKVGVVPLDDARHLARDYGLCVAGTLDLRHMARAANCRPLGLAKMALEHLGVVMDKDWRISCSNWEAAQLSARQIDYAAKDALVAVELFRHFASHRAGAADALSWWWLRRMLKPNLAETMERCEQWLDVDFSAATVASGNAAKNQRNM